MTLTETWKVQWHKAHAQTSVHIILSKLTLPACRHRSILLKHILLFQKELKAQLEDITQKQRARFVLPCLSISKSRGNYLTIIWIILKSWHLFDNYLTYSNLFVLKCSWFCTWLFDFFQGLDLFDLLILICCLFEWLFDSWLFVIICDYLELIICDYLNLLIICDYLSA